MSRIKSIICVLSVAGAMIFVVLWRMEHNAYADVRSQVSVLEDRISVLSRAYEYEVERAARLEESASRIIAEEREAIKWLSERDEYYAMLARESEENSNVLSVRIPAALLSGLRAFE